MSVVSCPSATKGRAASAVVDLSETAFTRFGIAGSASSLTRLGAESFPLGIALKE